MDTKKRYNIPEWQLEKIETLCTALKAIRQVQNLYPYLFLVFTGGTALSFFYLGHRFSEDLDLIITGTDEKQELETVESISIELRKYGTIQSTLINFEFGYYEYLFTDKSKKNTIKIEIARKFFRDLFPYKEIASLKVESLTGILFGKIEAILSRNETKDIIDFFSVYYKYPLTVIFTLNKVPSIFSNFKYSEFIKKIQKISPEKIHQLYLWGDFKEIDFNALIKDLIRKFSESIAIKNTFDPEPDFQLEKIKNLLKT